MNFDYMHKNTKIASVSADYDKNSVKVINFTEDPLLLPFGLNSNPTIKEFDDFLRSRCFPESRPSKKALLQKLNLDYYDPRQIVLKTHGTMFEDYFWLRFEGEEVDYEKEIKLRD